VRRSCYIPGVSGGCRRGGLLSAFSPFYRVSPYVIGQSTMFVEPTGLEPHPKRTVNPRLSATVLKHAAAHTKTPLAKTHNSTEVETSSSCIVPMPRGHVGQKRTTQTLDNIRVLSDVRKDALPVLANRTCSRTRRHPGLAVLSPGARLDTR
jgi:hypothetical protein